MEQLTAPPDTLDDVTQKLTVAVEVWAGLRDRSLRCGDRDRQLLTRRNLAMDGIDLLLDSFVMLTLLENEAALA